MILLRAFKLDDDEDVVSRWHKAHSDRPKVRASLDNRMIYLRQQAREGWIRPMYDTLRDGVGEVRFKADKINHRAIGFFGPERNDFTFCVFATKTDAFDPPNAIDLAVNRRVLVKSHPKLSVRLTRWGQT